MRHGVSKQYEDDDAATDEDSHFPSHYCPKPTYLIPACCCTCIFAASISCSVGELTIIRYSTFCFISFLFCFHAFLSCFLLGATPAWILSSRLLARRSAFGGILPPEISVSHEPLKAGWLGSLTRVPKSGLGRSRRWSGFLCNWCPAC